MLGADPTASDPTAARPALQRPAELLAAGRPADAAAALAAVVADVPTYAAAFVLLGVALDAAGRPAEALGAWHRAAFLVPNSPLVLRERRRLLAATAAETPADETLPEPSIFDTAVFEAPVEDVPVAEPDIVETPVVETVVEESEIIETEVAGVDDVEMPADDEPEPDEPAASAEDDPDEIQTAPLDDFVFADAAPGPDDDDGFDPDAFDFSAFDLGDDEPADWLTDAAPGGPPVSDPAEFDLMEDDEPLAFDPPADLADWAETTDASVRLVSPEAPEPDEALADAALTGETPEEAVFHDVTEAPQSPLDAPVSNSLLPDMPPAEAAWAPDPPAGHASVADELDSLIASLEDAPRIRPDAAFSGPAVRVTEADVDAMASETLARIYAAQHQYVRAALVYETLAAREPARAEAMLAQAAEMRRRK